MKKLLFSTTLLFISFLQLNAQQIPQKVQRSKWVKIMANDSSYNFLEAQKEFEAFYKDYLKEMNKEQKRRERNGSSPEEEHMESPVELLVADYLKWSITIKPFVRADGTIIPLSARLVIINENKRK